MRRPKYRRHTARDRAFVEYAGKRTYLPGRWKSPESQAAYRRFLLEHGLTHREPSSGKPSLVAGLAAAFIEWANLTYPPGNRSEAANCRAAIRHLVDLDGSTKILDYGPKRLEALQHRLAHAKKSRNYINAVCARVKRAFKWAASDELAPASVYYALATVPGLRKGRSLAVETKPRAPVLWEHVEPVLPELSPTVRAMVLCQWFTGIRSQSVCQARAGQFTLAAAPWLWRPRHKSEHLEQDLVVFVGPQCRRILAPFLEGRPADAFLFQPRHLNGRRAKGFRAFYDSVSYLRAISRAITRVNKARAKAGQPPIPHWTPHQLRHARATLVRERHGLEAAQAALGHARLDTAQIYARALLEKARAVAEEMG